MLKASSQAVPSGKSWSVAASTSWTWAWRAHCWFCGHGTPMGLRYNVACLRAVHDTMHLLSAPAVPWKAVHTLCRASEDWAPSKITPSVLNILHASSSRGPAAHLQQGRPPPQIAHIVHQAGLVVHALDLWPIRIPGCSSNQSHAHGLAMLSTPSERGLSAPAGIAPRLGSAGAGPSLLQLTQGWAGLV